MAAVLDRCTKMAQSNELNSPLPKNPITNYFPVKKRIEFVDVSVIECETIPDSFYKNCLNEKLVCGANCESRKIELKNRLKEEQAKLLNLEKSLSSCLFILNLKNEKIEKLMKKNGLNEEKVSAAVNTTKHMPKSPLNIVQSPKSVSSGLFNGYQNDFTSEQLAELRSFGKEMRNDSTFVLKVMRFIYADDITVLKGIRGKILFQ